MKQKALPPHDNVAWKGYTIDEIRYQRALTMARMEIERERLFASAGNIYKGIEQQSSSGIMGRLLSGLNYVDYVMLAFKLGRSLFNIFGRSRRR